MELKENGESSNSGSAGAVDRIWRFFSSTKLALSLILIIGGFSLLGTFITAIDIFHSWLFLAAGGLLIINILVCSLNRWSSIKHIISGGEVKKKESFYTAANSHAEMGNIAQSPEEASKAPEKVLRRRGYRVRVESDNEGVYLAADKNRYFRLGTYVSHLSLILLVIAYVLGGYLGFRDTDFAITEGSIRAVGHDTGLELQLISFVDEYYPDDMPKDYRSQVVLYENGQEVERALVRVNYPLIYKGVRFYQSFFGPAVQIKIMQNGTQLYQGSVGLNQLSQSQGISRNFGLVDLPTTGLTLRIISSGGTADSMIPPGQIAVNLRQGSSQLGMDLAGKGVPVSMGGLEITYQSDSRFSGFQVSRDPGNALFWIASVFFMLGTVLVFYFPYRQVWVLSQPQKERQSRIVVRLGTAKSYNGDAELKTLLTEMEKELPAKTGKRK